MPQILALEWNDAEARVVVASLRGERVAIDHAFSVALHPPQPDEDPPQVNVGERIAAALAARGIHQGVTLVAVGRSSIELRQLALPPTPDAELPDMVRFQAIREFGELADDWLLDFVPLDDSPEGARNVLAAAIGPKPVERIRQACETAGLNPQRLLLRPCAAASLLARTRLAAPGKVTLLVDLLFDEADLTVMIDRQVVFLRTARLGGDPLEDAAAAQTLLAEIRRTTAAAQNQLGGKLVESIVLYGSDERHAELARSIGGSMAMETECFDPFAGLHLGSELRGALPDHSGRFAPLLGMALAELEQTGQAIDFFDPRRPAPPPSQKKKLTGAAVAIAVIVMAFFGYRIWDQFQLNREIRTLQQESDDLDEKLEATLDALAAVDALEKWETTDTVWLDELYRLSMKFPPAKEAMVTKLTLSGGIYNRKPVPKIELSGLAASTVSIGEVEEKLQDESHPVRTGGSSPDDSNRFYRHKFAADTFIVDREQK